MNEQNTETSLRRLNPEKAFDEARALAERNKAEGFYCLARFFETGFGTELNIVKAMRYFEEAAKSGSNVSACYLGDALSSGIWGFIDENKAFYWYQYAAQAGDVDAAFALSNCFLRGLGTKKDDTLAKKWLKKAAEAGNKSAKMILASDKGSE